MPAVSVLMKPASSLCNLSCDYCFYCDEAEKRSQKSFGFMSLQTLKNVIRKTMLRAEGTVSYAFQGGEPSLRGLDFFRQAAAWQKQYNQNHVRVQNAFQTNGYLIDEEWCEFFWEHQFLVGLSLDGTPEIHNSLRHDRKSGGETFDRISYSADLMDAYGVDYNILTVVTPAVAKNIAGVYSYYKERGWNYQQYIACLDPLGEKHGHASHSLTPEVYGEFLIDLFFLWSRDLKNGKQPYIRQFENWIGLSAGYLAESCDQRGVCAIQNVVEADGSVYPCDFYMLDEYRLGNFNEDRLDAIDARREALGFVERSRQLDSECRQCKYYRICRGGCQRNRDFNPATGLYENYFCPAYRMFFDRYYGEITEIGKQIDKR
ncbi:anaerobic sulfatase maturase [Schaedlerella arabinosiphila]|uniref:Anaerobic sulfatase maturase n=1 Tax=Schaedlerella arabinosiphila TaxID=2044587 RepID=A0A9X5C572_9FIRM|nr:anaerobic sulfatase maturase [Schaedlerella arabinosiphila]NDO67768.1 anaerobic sulfatase maturase [Schaedlerella arabinosiphila]